MNDPFIVHDDDIKDSDLTNLKATRWVEGVQVKDGVEIEYLKPSLRIKRVWWACTIFIMVAILLASRGIYLQIFNHDKYLSAAEINRLRIEKIKSPRGIIQDRTGVNLTKNIPRFRMVLNPLEFPRAQNERMDLMDKLSEITNLSYDAIKNAADVSLLPVAPKVIMSNLTLEEIYPLTLAIQNIPGVIIEPASVREYPMGEEFSHILGYLGSIAESEVDKYLSSGYYLSDSVGKTGLEYSLESELHGADGRKYIEVDAKGEIKNVVAYEEVKPGNNIKLTIDAEFQKAVYEILKKYLEVFSVTKGTVIVNDPNNGEILAMVSIPTFDNNIFTSRRDVGEEMAKLFFDPDKPLFLRAVSGTYPSGSTIKPVVAAAALQEGIITENTSFLSTGGLRIKTWFFPDWRAGGHGMTNVRHALADSVNTFFYIISGGYENIAGLGAEKLSGYLRSFGFGSLINSEFPNEAKGLVSDPDWKQEVKNEPWYIGDTYHLAIGQGDISATPMQISRMLSYFASGGKWTQPHIVLSNSGDAYNGPIIDSKYVEIIRQGLADAVRYGSARSLSSLPISSAGKTGTAQWSTTKDPHAWFVGWAPFEDPKILTTVLIEEGGGGSRTATPVAKDIMQWWYNNRISK